MMKLVFITTLLALTSMFSCGQSELKASENRLASAGDVPRITVEDAKKAFDEGAVFIDVRAADQYNQEHIKGALNIQGSAPESEFDKIPKGKKIIVYCS